ncbi:MAG: TetR/AcrR family transcriptional regulator [Myxococcota bacterium]
MVDADPAQRILRAASKLLTEEGPTALTNRRIALEAGCTTMAIYSRYGSKGGVLEALFNEGVDRIAEAQRSVSADLGGLAVIEGMCVAFRQTALRFPGHYGLIFGPSPKDYEPSEVARQRSRQTFDVLVGAVARAVEQGHLVGVPSSIAFELFAMCHGHVTLALAGMVPLDEEPEVAYIAAVRQALSGYAVTA